MNGYKLAGCALAFVMLIGLSSCSSRNFARVSSGEDVWSTGVQSTVSLLTLDDEQAVDFIKSMSFYLDKADSDGVDEQLLASYKALLSDMGSYESGTNALAGYVHALYECGDCLLGFYYFNSTDDQLTQKITATKTAYQKLSKLQQTSISLESSERWVSCAAKFQEYGHLVQSAR